MFITVRRYEGVPNPRETGQRVTEGFVPLVSQVPGFVAYYWADAGAGTMISTGVFQDRTGAEESNKKAAEWIKQNPSLFTSPAQITAGEVVGHKTR